MRKPSWYWLVSLTISIPLSAQAQNLLDDYPVFQKGMSFVCWEPNTYSSIEASRSLEQLANTNTKAISLLTTWYMDSLNSINIHQVSEKTPTDESLRIVINNARNLEIDIMLKPHLDILDGSWRGFITFSSEADWQAWFNSYQNFISHYAQLARDNNIKLFSIGTELKGTTHRATNWQAVINQIKRVDLYPGKITYAANFDEFDKITWWQDLDYIGIDAYFPLTNTSNPTLSELAIAWNPYIAKLESIYNQFQKPILFTEIGYQSRNGTNIQPWTCLNTSADSQEQADCYDAIYWVLFHKSWFYGTYWWNWAADPSKVGQCDQDYTPRGKPAETILKNWYAQEKKTAVKNWSLFE